METANLKNKLTKAEHEPQASQASVWENAVIYQIYPRSFLDERGEGQPTGEGSLLGIEKRLDYLKSLSVDAIWLSPFFPSPLKDGGYDVSNYNEVDPRYGTLEDFKDLVESAKQKDIKLMIDFVLNHTSDQHDWFKQSKSSRDNDKADWYIWANAAEDGGVPNNWASVFSLEQLKKRQAGELELGQDELTPYKKAWTWDETRQQYYMHSFGEFQPDLNWSNPEVRQAMKEVLRFWLDLGVEGFRVDAVNHIGKDMTLHDEEANPDYQEGVDNPYDQLERYHSCNYPETLYRYLEDLTYVLHEPKYSKRDTRLVFEAYANEDVINHLNAIDSDHAGAFNFIRMDARWDAKTQEQLLDHYYKHLPENAIPNNVNGNHDKPRLATRLGPGGARLAALINATLPGQMYIYNGEEIGMENVAVPENKLQDKLGFRDEARTPMQWTAERNAGFSTVDKRKLWLPVGMDFAIKNITSEINQRHSSLWLYKAMLYMKEHYPELQKGQYSPLVSDNQSVLAFARRHEDSQLVIAANFANEPVNVRLSGTEMNSGRVILSTDTIIDRRPQVDLDKLELGAEEGVIITASA